MRAFTTCVGRSCSISAGPKRPRVKCRKPQAFPTKRGRNGTKNWKTPIRTCGNRPNPSVFCYTYVVFQPTPAADISSNCKPSDPEVLNETSIENSRNRNRSSDRDCPRAAFRGEREYLPSTNRIRADQCSGSQCHRRQSQFVALVG